MMMTQSDDVVRRASQVSNVAREASRWLDTNSPRLKEDPSVLSRDFRRFERRARRLQTAAGRRACVAVFGASQAGKSYLVSGLATPPGKPLLVRYGDTTLNFLRDLNPQGGKESTGLVSRFTMQPVPAPAGAPVALRLLSQTDVIKVLANTFLEDFKIVDLKAPEPTAITALFDQLAGSAGAEPTGGMVADDVEEMREYFELHFSGHGLIQALGSAYWSRAAEVIPRLPPDRRAEAYAPLWNGTQAFTRLARALIVASAELGFPDIAFVRPEALVPREQSVLDVNMVFGLGEVGAAGASKPSMLQVVSDKGRTASLDRALVAALIAEVTLPLAEQPWDFLDHTDLLDFPGARSREEIIKPEEFLAEPGRLGRAFLRGKVAYLFQRYQAEQETAAMLLCVGPSNQDVQTLPRMVATWIDQTIGTSPSARANQRNSLFLVLTQFDKEFEEKAGEDVASGQRWTTRLEASLLEFFGKSYAWPREWAPGRAFDNAVWLRSTAIGFKAVFDYAPAAKPEDPPVEVAIGERAKADVASKKAIYLANDLVRRHFADPARAWDEALRPNDGGITYLAEKLRPVCNPMLKAEQVAGRIEDLAVAIAQRLRPYFHTGNMVEELERAAQNARDVQRALVRCAEAQMFGALLRALQVTSDQMLDVWWRLQSEPEHAAPIGVASLGADYGGELGITIDDDTDGARSLARDRFEHFADLAIAAWTETMNAFAEETRADGPYRIPREQAATLVGEIGAAARRLGLRTQLADRLRKRAVFQNRSSAAPQIPVIIAESTINTFITMLGYDTVAPEKRPRTVNGSRLIFAPRPAVIGAPSLAAEATAYDRIFHIDWMIALGETFRENVRNPSSTGLDLHANAALGQILQNLEARRT
jgi:hypothetical protein